MANVPTIKGKENLYKHFQATKACYWKIHNAFDQKTPLMVYDKSKNIGESLASLKDFIELLDPEGIYILDTFIPKDDKQKDLIRPDTSICFTIQDHYAKQIKKDETVGTTASGYTPEFGAHIKLITDNARLIAENEFSATKLTEALQEANRLRNENLILHDTIEEYENEEEEEEEGSVSGLNMSAKDQLMSAFAGLIKEKGGAIIESFAGNGFKKENVVTPINGTDTETQSVMALYNGLKKHDPEIFEHLVKLLAIADNQPDIFKMVITNLDAMQ